MASKKMEWLQAKYPNGVTDEAGKDYLDIAIEKLQVRLRVRMLRWWVTAIEWDVHIMLLENPYYVDWARETFGLKSPQS